MEREDKEYVINIIQSHLNRNVIGLGYKEHVVHNCAKRIFDSIPIDMEVPVTQIFLYFHIRTIHMEGLQYYCFFIGQDCKQKY